MLEHPLQKIVHNQDWKRYYDSLKETNQLTNPQALKWLIYVRAYHDFEFFVRAFFPHHCKFPFSSMHWDFFREEACPARRGRRNVIAAPRGHAKTTFKTLFKVLHAIAYGYERFILVMSHAAPEAVEKVQAILEELEENALFHQIFGPLAPVRGQRIEGARWGKKCFVTRNGIKVQAKSRCEQIRGLKHGADRPTLVICDDVEAPEGVLNPDQRKKTRDWFEKDLLKCGQIDGSTNITVIGTCLHPDSLLAELLRSPGWQARKYQAVLSFAQDPALWSQYQALYTNLSDPQRQETAQAFFEAHREAMLAGTTVLWPDGEPYERLMRMRIDEGEASFSSEKQNDPYDPERQLFKMDLVQQCRVLFDGKAFSGIQWLTGDSKIVPRSQITRIIAFHDPALGRRPGQHSEPDYAAIVVVAQDRDGYLYCLDAWIEKEPPSVQVTRALMLQEKWGFDVLYFEENHFQQLLRPLVLDAQERRGGPVTLRVVGVQQHANKIQRIATLEPEMTNGYLLFAESLTPRLRDQLTLFPTGHDDGPDALQGAVAQLKKTWAQVNIGLPIQTGGGPNPLRSF